MNTGDLGRLAPRRLSGSEPLHAGGAPTGATVLDFWRWSGSDLVVNTARGLLAEYIVAHALEISTAGVRDAWAVWDLTTPDDITIEVKSGAYLQSWFQKAPSAISFGIKAATAWNPDTNAFEGDRARHADVYVFALLAHRDKATLDPLDVAQWQFFVVPTRVLNEELPTQQSVSLATLERLGAGPHLYAGLHEAVTQAKSFGAG